MIRDQIEMIEEIIRIIDFSILLRLRDTSYQDSHANLALGRFAMMSDPL